MRRVTCVGAALLLYALACHAPSAHAQGPAPVDPFTLRIEVSEADSSRDAALTLPDTATLAQPTRLIMVDGADSIAQISMRPPAPMPTAPPTLILIEGADDARSVGLSAHSFTLTSSNTITNTDTSTSANTSTSTSTSTNTSTSTVRIRLR